MRNLERWGGFIFVVLVSVGVLGVSIYFWDWLSGGSKYRNGDTARNVALSIGGVWAIYAVFLAAIRVKIMQQQQVSESLAKAAEQLSSGVMSVRILAILSLEKIAIEAQDEIRQDVVKVLCAYVRENRPIGQEGTQSTNSKSPMPEDIQEIINVLSGMKNSKQAGFDMNLSKTNLWCANLSGANLSGANLWFSHLSGAHLSCANLSGAHLWLANLLGADLSGADLSGAHLSGANLSGARLGHTNLSGAHLSDANLLGANLWGADLSGGDLERANLSGADLLGANLSGADLSGTGLGRANLLGANMSGVKGLDTAKNLETVKNPPQEILDEIARRKQD